MHPILHAILKQKMKDIDLLHQLPEDSDVKKILRGEHHSPACRFTEALQQPFSIIAEFKRTSPALGKLNHKVTLQTQVQKYQQYGANAISVITESSHFDGCIEDLKTARLATSLPLLRKDFIIDDIQIAESIAAGCDAILLIVSLCQDNTATLLRRAKEMGVDVLLEVHTPSELAYALSLEIDCIGINNRDLMTFAVNPRHALEMLPRVTDKHRFIAESGIHEPSLAAHYQKAGYAGLLIGSSLMTANDPGALLQALKGGTHATQN